jgi:hypothetical protein
MTTISLRDKGWFAGTRTMDKWSKDGSLSQVRVPANLRKM